MMGSGKVIDMSDVPGPVRVLAERLRPARPSAVGVDENVPDISRIAAARVLANEALDVLAPRGFTDEQLRLWAEAYLFEEHSGDLESFLAWIATKETIITL